MVKFRGESVRAFLIVWVACFAACWLAAFWSGTDKRIWIDGARPRAQFIDLDWPAEHVVQSYWGGPEQPYRGADLASYLLAGRHVLRTGKFDPGYVEFWPPALPFTIAGIIRFTGESEYPFKMVVAGVFLWSLALAALVLLIPASPNRVAAVALPLAFLLLPELREWTFGFGSLMTETSSHAVLMISIAACLVAIHRQSLAWAALGATLFALAAYYRAAFEMQGEAVFAAMTVVALIAFAVKRSPATKRLALAALLAVGVFNVALAPWRLYKKHYFGTTRWYSADDAYVFGFVWKKDDELRWYMRGANPACHVDPEQCEALFQRRGQLKGREVKQAAFSTLAHHPFGWFAFKVKNLHWLWFNRSWSSFTSEPLIFLEGLLLLVLGLLGFAALSRRAYRSRDPTSIGVLAFLIFLAGINIAIFTFLHFEWRYSQTLRTLCFFLPLVWLWLRSLPANPHSARAPAS